MMLLTQAIAGILVAMAGIASLGVGLGLAGPQAAGRPASQAAGRVPESWIGKKVIITYAEFFPRADLAGIEEILSVYTVDRVDGERVHLVVEGFSGWWEPAAEVVLLDRAMDLYSREIATNGRNLAARLRRAQLWESQGQRVRGIAELTEAIQTGPPSAVVYAVRGKMLRDEGQTDRAIADFTEAIKLDPKHVWAHIDRGLLWSQKGDHDKAIADFTEAIKLDPNNECAYCDRGIDWSDKGEFDRALTDLDEAIRLGPDDALARVARGDVWLKKKDYNKAIADFTEAIRLDPDAGVLRHSRGNARYMQQDVNGAIADFTEAIRLDPRAPGPRKSRGNAWLVGGDNDKAITDLDEAIRLGSKDARTWFLRGLAFKAKGSYDRALADLDEAIHLDPKAPEPYGARAWIWATCPDAKHRDGRRAIASATKACELAGWKDPDHLAALAAAHSEVGEFESAVKRQAEANALHTDPAAKKNGEALLESYMKSLKIQVESMGRLG